MACGQFVTLLSPTFDDETGLGAPCRERTTLDGLLHFCNPGLTPELSCGAMAGRERFPVSLQAAERLARHLWIVRHTSIDVGLTPQYAPGDASVKVLETRPLLGYGHLPKDLVGNAREDHVRFEEEKPLDVEGSLVME